MFDHRVKEIDFKTIRPFWSILWPHKIKITPVSTINFRGIINEKLLYFKPVFFAYFLNDKIVGVNSIIQTSEEMCRIRGIWVNPKYRGNQIGFFLLKYGHILARMNKMKKIWSMPRNEALNFYLKNGYKIASDFFYDYEFGPHCFVMKEL
jgi:hypothetical protein